MANVVIIETGNSHDECLYTQIHAFYARNVAISIICNTSLAQRNPWLNELTDTIYTVSDPEKGINQFKEIKPIYKKLRQNGLKLLVFNTVHGKITKKICLFALVDKVTFVGVAHYVQKFKSSFGQKIIGLKVKKYFVLAEFLLNIVPDRSRLKFSYFYPIHFPDGSIEKQPHEGINVTVIGGVEEFKKDISGFIELLKKSGKDKVHFTFLGKSDEKKPEVQNLIKQLEKLPIHLSVDLFFKYVSIENFNSVLQQTDWILPLIHPNTVSGEMYFKNKISGAMNVAIGYGIPLLLHEELQTISELSNTSVYYSFDNFFNQISNISARATIRDKIESEHAYKIDFQEKKYLSFLDLNSLR